MERKEMNYFQVISIILLSIIGCVSVSLIVIYGLSKLWEKFCSLSGVTQTAFILIAFLCSQYVAYSIYGDTNESKLFSITVSLVTISILFLITTILVIESEIKLPDISFSLKRYLEKRRSKKVSSLYSKRERIIKQHPDETDVYELVKNITPVNRKINKLKKGEKK